MRVASYNVHACVGTDGRLDVARVARVIDELGADVVGLQEVYARRIPGTRQLAELARLTDMRPIAGVTLRRGKGEYGNALLVRGASVVHARRRDLTVLRREPRGGLAVELDRAGQPLQVVVTHLGLLAWERRQQVRDLIRWLEWYVERPDVPTVVMGDLNEWRPWVRPLRQLAAHLRPARRVRSFPSRLPLLPLDRLYLAGPGRLVGVRAHRSHLARRASDHLPVCGWLEFSL